MTKFPFYANCFLHKTEWSLKFWFVRFTILKVYYLINSELRNNVEIYFFCYYYYTNLANKLRKSYSLNYIYYNNWLSVLAQLKANKLGKNFINYAKNLQLLSS